MRGSDKIILRTKGGASKQMIKTSPKFKVTRKLNTEFGGRAKASSLLLKALWPLKPLADYNLSGPVNALLKPIQAMDTDYELGQRSILFSRGAPLLSGFHYNRIYPFDSVVRAPVSFTMDMAQLSAAMEIPDMLPGINFHPPARQAFFGFVAVLGMVPDLHYSNKAYAPEIPLLQLPQPATFFSEWYPVSKGAPGMSLLLELTQPPVQGYGLVLGIGIRYGAPGNDGAIEQVKWAGSAKVLMGNGSGN